MKRLIILLSGLAVIAAPGLSTAAYLGGGEDFALSKGDIIADNVYVAGGNLTAASDVLGDLVAAGGTVLVSGAIGSDLLIGGGTVNVIGSVGEDVRGVAGTLVMTGPVGGEVAAVGGTIHLVSGGRIAGDLMVAGGRVVIDGEVSGRSTIRAGEVVINGSLLGPVSVVAEKISIGDKAELKSGLSYSSPVEATIAPGARIVGQIDHKTLSGYKDIRRDVRGAAGAIFGIWWFAKLLMLLVVGLIIFFVWRRSLTAIVHEATSRFWKDMLWGFLALVAMPVAIIVVGTTVVGLLLAALGLMAYLSLIILASVYSGIIFGSVATRFLMKEDNYRATWPVVVGGIISFQLVQMVPFIGWLLGLAFFLTAVGTVTRSLVSRLELNQ